MSTKPSTVANWAASGPIVVPSSGKQALGFVSLEAPPAQYLDWLFNVAAQWQQWLSDGNCAFNNLSAAGTLGATGAATLGSTVSAAGLASLNGGIAVPTAKAVTLSGTTTLTVGTGATVLGGLLSVAGATTLTGGVAGGLALNGATSGAVTHTTPATVTSYAVTWPAAAPTAPVGTAIVRMTTAGAVDFSVADRVYVSAANAQLTSIGLAAGANIATFDGTAWFLNTSGGGQGPVFDIPLWPGKTLASVKAFLFKGTNNTKTIQMFWSVRNMITGSVVASGTASTSANAPGVVSISDNTGLPITMADGYCLTATIQGSATSGDSVYGVGGIFA